MDPPKRQLLSRRSGTKTIGLLAEIGQAAKLLPGANPLGSLPSHGVDRFHRGLTLCLTVHVDQSPENALMFVVTNKYDRKMLANVLLWPEVYTMMSV